MSAIPGSSPGTWQRVVASLLLAAATMAIVAWVFENNLVQFFWFLGGFGLAVAAVVYGAVWRHGFRWLFSRGALRFYARLAAGVLSLVVLFYAEEGWRGKRAWAALQREACARGETLTFSSLAGPAIPEDQNLAAAPGVAELLGLKNQTNPRSPFYHGSEYRWPLANWTAQQFTDLAAWGRFFRSQAEDSVDAERRGFALNFPAAPEPGTPAAEVLFALGKYETNLATLLAGSQRPALRFPVNYDRGFFVMEDLRRPLESLWAAEHLLTLRASAELAEEGRAEAAARDVVQALGLAELLREEPFDSVQRYRRGMLRFCLQPIWEGVAAHRWNDGQLREIQAKLAQIDLVADRRRDLRGEALMTMSLVDQALAFVTGEPSEFTRSTHGNDAEELFWGWTAKLFYPVGWLYQDKVWIYRYYQRHAGPFSAAEFPGRFGKEWRSEVRSASDPLLVVFVLPRLRETFVEGSRGVVMLQTYLQQAATACALERFRLARGEFPAALADLAPAYLPQVPADLLAPSPSSLKYRGTPDGGFLLYSVGLNQVDDGGKRDPAPETHHSPWWVKDSDPDLVWITPGKR